MRRNIAYKLLLSNTTQYRMKLQRSLQDIYKPNSIFQIALSSIIQAIKHSYRLSRGLNLKSDYD